MKIAPDIREEVRALRAFDGRGCVALLDYDLERGAIVLPRAKPGATLSGLCERDDVAATAIAAAVIRSLHADERKGDAASVFEMLRELGSFHALAADANDIASDLAAERLRFLHGDLHHDNIVSDGSGWIAIDPKGMSGPIECELAPLLLNPSTVDIERLLHRRIEQLCDALDLDRERTYRACFIRAALGIGWALEDDGHAPDRWLAVAEQLRSRI